MFRLKTEHISDLLNKFLRAEGLETPMLQQHILASWSSVVGETVAKYTEKKYIKNQTLYVKIGNPALRNNLNMMKTDLLNQINAFAGSRVIYDIRFY